VVLKLAKTYKNKVTLILWDYNELAVQGTANEVEKAGCSKVHAFTVDVSNHEQIAQTAETV
jgi:ERCC4-type nuclease